MHALSTFSMYSKLRLPVGVLISTTTTSFRERGNDLSGGVSLGHLIISFFTSGQVAVPYHSL
jgi:hypothetical protein